MPVALVTLAMLSPSPLLFIITKIGKNFLYLWYMDSPKPKKKPYQRKIPQVGFLKYWKVIRLWAKYNHELTTDELEVILYLYGIKLFTANQYARFDQRRRFYELQKRGWINLWRDATHKRHALYELSYKGKRMVNHIYKILLGEETIGEHETNNPIFNYKDSSQTKRRVRYLIEEMNKAVTGF